MQTPELLTQDMPLLNKKSFEELDNSFLDSWTTEGTASTQSKMDETSEPQAWSFLDAAAAIATSVKRAKVQSLEDSPKEWRTPVIDQPPMMNSEVLLGLLSDGNLGFANTKFFAPPPEDLSSIQNSRRWSSPFSDLSSPGSSTSSLCSSPMSTASFLDENSDVDFSLVDNLMAGYNIGEGQNENRVVDGRAAALSALSATSPYVDPTTYDESQNQFRLMYPLNPEQRKSYHRENRYLAPNPIIIGPKDDNFSVETGVVSVELVDERGMPVSQDGSNRCRYLESSPPDQMKRWIHSKEPTAKFTLKIMENSGPTRFRLKFLVDYVLQDGTTVSEVVFSNSFIVHYNKKRKGSFSQPNSLNSSTDSLPSYSDVFSPDFLQNYSF